MRILRFHRLNILPQKRVDAAFHFVKPGPSSGSVVLAFKHGGCAWKATNAAKAAIRQGIVRYFVEPKIIPYLVTRPVCERIYLENVSSSQRSEEHTSELQSQFHL